MLGDERMTTINCDCGAKYDRVASHKKEALGFQCRHCLRNWRSQAVKTEKGQTRLWFKYYECKCGSNTLNIPPAIVYCICEGVELR